jgi:hypothetical protein
MSDHTHDYLSAIGSGNVSAGIRILIEQIRHATKYFEQAPVDEIADVETMREILEPFKYLPSEDMVATLTEKRIAMEEAMTKIKRRYNEPI